MKSRYLRYIRELLDICHAKKWTAEVIGYTHGPKKFSIYKIVLDAKKSTNIKTACFIAGVHGNEISGPLSVKHFLKRHTHEPQMPRTVIMPVANPTGFDRDIYRNIENENINRGYEARNLTGERAIILEAILNEHPEYFVSFHEDDVKKTVYLYGYCRRPKSPAVFRSILNDAGRFCAVDTKKRIYKYKSNQGLVLNAPHDGSLEDRMRIEGVPYCICFEAPDHSTLPVRIKANISVMGSVIHRCSESIS